MDRYVRLFARTSLFPWDYLPDGCVSRATCVAEWLRLLKVPWNSVKKRFIFCYVYDEFGSLGIDYYHVAIEVILRNKTSLIIDPMVEKEYGLPHDEWIRRLNLKVSFYEEDLVDADMLLLLNREKNERQYFKMTPDDMKPINRQLANYRFEHEKDLLSSLKVLSEPQPNSQSPLWKFPSQSQYFGFDDADMII